MTATPNAIDVLVGGNLRRWRLEREVTVRYAAAALGVSAASFESMEAGATRIGAADLQKLCGLLRIGPAALYADRDLQPAA